MHLCSHHHGIALTQHWYVLTFSAAHAEEGSLVMIHTIIQDISLDFGLLSYPQNSVSRFSLLSAQQHDIFFQRQNALLLRKVKYPT